MNLVPESAVKDNEKRLLEPFIPGSILLSDREKASFQKIIKRQREIDEKKIKRKLIQVSEKNESLTNAIEEKNEEIEKLKTSIKSLNDVINSVPLEELRANSSTASMKIVELGQKNRQLRDELTQAKYRNAKKELEMKRLENELRDLREKQCQTVDLPRKNDGTPEEMMMKLSALQQKLFESRNRNTELQGQLKLAQKCLQQEVGENFNLNVLASQATQSNWRGRAQQIIHLQQKMQELRERLEAVEHANGVARLQGGAIVGFNNRLDSSSSIQTSQDERLLSGGRKSEYIQHRLKVEALEKEIDSLRSQLEDQRSKTLALKVRNKTLNDDIIKYRTNAKCWEQQTDYNGMNLAAMSEQMVTQRHQFDMRLESQKRELEEMQRQRDDALYKEKELLVDLQNMKTTLQERENTIEEERQKSERLENDLKAVCGDFLFSCRELHKEDFISILDSLESEKNHLMMHVNKLEARLQDERQRNETSSEQISKQKVRISRLEGRIKEMEKEQELLSEKKRRSQRISEYANSISSTGSGNVPSFVFENTSLSKVSLHSLNNSSEKLTPAQILDLKQQLELATEKITMLEEKIKYLTEEKENDAIAFQQTLINSKDIIRDALLSRRVDENVFIGNSPISSVRFEEDGKA